MSLCPKLVGGVIKLAWADSHVEFMMKIICGCSGKC